MRPPAMLDAVLAAALDLKDALAREVERARREREVLRTLDSDRLFASAAERAAFNAEVGRRERALADALRAAGGAFGLSEVSVASLARRAPREAAALSRLLADVGALAGALAELDRLNVMLAGRALACVQGYLSALQPTPTAYDRRGLRATGASLAAYSSKA